ncbi:MAG: NADH-ubiquinone oxidoreductase-F iron-sulfur binding region domain-containing protein [Euzebya sp.]
MVLASTDIAVRGRLGVDPPMADLADYRSRGGGQAIRIARQLGAAGVIDQLTASGLQGRGGGAFVVGHKWRSVADHACPTRFVVANAAEGEPGTFKDRWLLQRNPYQVLEGLAVAALTIGASRAFLAVKATFHPALAAVRAALADLNTAGLLGEVNIEIITGPEDYLFGEEKAMLEVIEDRQPLPRILPPYQVGLFASRGSPNPTVVNNVETMAHVVTILTQGPDAFRQAGTATCPGTMLFTVCGDVSQPGVFELPLGTSLRTLLFDHAGGPLPGRHFQAVFPGASCGVVPAAAIDVALDFDHLAQIGSALGSAGFVVYDDTACVVGATAAFSRFLARESCAQCPACQQGTLALTELLDGVESGQATLAEMDTIRSRCRSVTGGSRCGLPAGEAAVVSSALDNFEGEFAEHVTTGGCPRPRQLQVPVLSSFDPASGQFSYAEIR